MLPKIPEVSMSPKDRVRSSPQSPHSTPLITSRHRIGLRKHPDETTGQRPVFDSIDARGRLSYPQGQTTNSSS
jgi:hypothetical protein